MGPRFGAFQSAVLMSATLKPPAYHEDLLGLSADRVVFSEHESGFPSENRGVYLATRVSTAFKDRTAHRDRTAALLTDIANASPGHIAIYYPSFAMLRSLALL